MSPWDPTPEDRAERLDWVVQFLMVLVALACVSAALCSSWLFLDIGLRILSGGT